MLLALSVIGTDAARLGLHGYKVFDERGGVIGRLDSSDWILHDPDHLVSASHVRIVHRDQAYFLEDTSTHGTFINDPERPVPRGAATRLRDGDRLFIGSFEVLVQLVDDLPLVVAGSPRRELEVLPELSIEPDHLYRPDQRKGPSLRTTQQPSQVTEPLKFGGPPRGAGFGADAMLRVSIEGLFEALQSQLKARQGMQVPGSLFDLSPLLKCANAQDALQTLLAGLGPGGETPPEIIAAAFRDIVFHDEAVHEAIHAAALAMIEQVHPRRAGVWSAEEQDAAKWLQLHFDIAFGKAYAQHLKMLRSQVTQDVSRQRSK